MHLSAEWFAAVDKFDVLDTEPFVGQSSGNTMRNDVIHEMAQVLNFAIGFEQKLGKKDGSLPVLRRIFPAPIQILRAILR